MTCGTMGTWEDTLAVLAELVLLADGWDGLGSRRPDPSAVLRAAAAAGAWRTEGRPVPQFVFAGSTGGVYFEWWTPTGYTETEFTAAGQATRATERGPRA